MAETQSDSACPQNPAARREGIRTGLMFYFSIAYIIVLAGLIHRFEDAIHLEVLAIVWALAALWATIGLESAHWWLTTNERPLWKRLLLIGSIWLAPPLRIGLRGRVNQGQLWLPRLGWRDVDRQLQNTLDKFFSIPMIVIALMVLPVLLVEYQWKEQIAASPALTLAHDISVSIIWLAFVIEFVVMVSVAPSKIRYCVQHWIELAIVLLPLLEKLPLARMLRLVRVLPLEQVSRMGRLYRLQAVLLKTWRAFLILEFIQRALGQTKERRLERLQELLRAKEEEIEELRSEITELEATIAAETTPEGNTDRPGDVKSSTTTQ